MYPIANMEPWARKLSAFMPLGYFAEIIRGAFIKGIGFSVLYRECTILGAIALVLLIAAVLRFRKRSA
jgi:ABC-2 type transport system permease protein